MNLSTRYLLTGVLGVLVLAAAAASATTWLDAGHARTRALERYRQAVAITSGLQQGRLDELQLRAHSLASDPAFVDYVAQALEPNPQLGGSIDSASINNLLQERRKGYDAAVVLDATGTLVTRSGMPLRGSTDYAHDPLIARVLRTHRAASGLWSGHGVLTRVAVDPLLRGNVLKGVLVVATRVTPALVDKVANITGLDVAMVVPSDDAATVPLSAGMDPTTLGALASDHPDVLARGHGARLARLPVDAGMAHAWVHPFATSDGHAALVLMEPGARISPWPILRRSDGMLTGIAMLTVLGLGVVVLLYMRTYRPLDDMRRILKRAADGETGITLRTGGNRVVRGLRDVINGVMDRHAP